MSDREKPVAIFEAMQKYKDYFIFVTLKHGSCVFCHGVGSNYVFVSHYGEPTVLSVWFEDIEDVTACHAYCEQLDDRIDIF